MSKCAIFKACSYNDDELYAVIKKHFEAHNIKDDIPENARVLIKPNLVSDKEAVFSVTTNPRFVYAIIRYLKDIGVNDITVADCPGGSVLLFSQMQDVYRRTGYEFLSEYAKLNLDFESRDIYGSPEFVNQKFNIINAISDADYIINVPKLKTHNITCITAGVKNLFGCIPGLQKPAFHAKYPAKEDFSNMLVELAATVKPDFTIVDAIDIMEGNGPANGKRRHLGLSFSSKDVFGLDKFIVNILKVPVKTVSTVSASEKKGWLCNEFNIIGDADFKIDSPLLLPVSVNAATPKNKLAANIEMARLKVDDMFFANYPKMNSKCVLCKKCVATCPVKALSIKNEKIVLNRKKCIGCLCCDEVCPNAAVDIKKKLKIGKQ